MKYLNKTSIIFTITTLLLISNINCKAETSNIPYTIPNSIVADCSVNVVDEINNWVQSIPDGTSDSRSIIEFKSDACYRIETSINVENRKHLYFDGKGATFRKVDKSAPSNVAGKQSMQWFIRSSDDIYFSNMTVEGSNTFPYPSSFSSHPEYESQHNWSCWGCTNLTIDGVTGLNAWGDFVATTADHLVVRQPKPKNIVVKNSTFKKSGRMGIAVTLGENFFIENNSFDEVAWSVLDIEIESADWYGKNINFKHNTIRKVNHFLVAAGGGFSSDIRDVTIEGNNMKEFPTTSSNVQINAVGKNWIIRNNTIRTKQFGIGIKNATNISIKNNTLYAKNYDAVPFLAKKSTNALVKNNQWLSADGIGYWDDYQKTNSTDIMLCGNRREINTDDEKYSPPDVVLEQDPVPCS